MSSQGLSLGPSVPHTPASHWGTTMQRDHNYFVYILASQPQGTWYIGVTNVFAKRLENGRFIWPVTQDGSVSLTSAQLSMLLEGIDWRTPQRTSQPVLA